MSDALWTSALLGTIGIAISTAGIATAAARESAPGVDRGTLAGIESALAAKEYEASENDHGLQAPNRAHGLRTYFEPTGIRVHDRTAAGSPQLLALSAVSAGRMGFLSPVPPGEVVHEGARVEIRRPGLVEWFVNSEAGLEQGFTLAEPPRGRGEVALELRVGLARAELSGDRVLFGTPAGRRLEYGKLAVRDADGRALPSRFEVPAPDRLRLVADDRGARYPLVFDPILTGVSEFDFSPAQLEARLGLSVASAGDVNGDGYADIIAGAYLYDGGNQNEGRAWVWYGSANGISGASPSEIDANQDDAELGLRVASAGDVNGDGYSDVIVGARFFNNPESDEGAAFVFHGGPSGIVASGNPSNADAVLESNQANAQMGRNVAGIGDVNGDGYADVAVAAPAYDGEGSVYVFLGSASGIPDGNPLNAAAELEGDEAGADFGVGLAGAGDVNGDGYADLIVGAPFFRNPDEGGAFVFLGSSSGIASAGSAAAASILESNQTLGGGAQFGWSVASAGDVSGDGYSDVIIGAPGYDIPSLDEGAAFIFHGSSTGVVPSGNPGNANTGLTSTQESSYLGISVAGAGDVNGDGYADVIVGAFGFDNPTNDEGKAFVFIGGPTGVTSATELSAYATLAGLPEQIAQFGVSVAGAGDVNGDGFADVIAGAWLQNVGAGDSGHVFVYHGGNQGIFTVGPWSALLESDQAGASLGVSVAPAGDVNGDGYSDLIIGAYGYDAGQGPGEGAAFVFHGGPSGIVTNGNPANAATQVESDQASAQLGWSVASAGDVNGDGYADVIVGAPHYDTNQGPGEGAAFVFLGSAAGVADGNPASAAARLWSDQASAQMGWSVASAGDVNGDGYSDVIVGARDYDAPQSDEGAAFVFLGSATGISDGIPALAAAQLESDQVSARMGWSVASAGDVNGDGYADVIVGAAEYDAPQADEAAAFVFLGSATGIADGSPTNASAQLESNQVGAGDWSVASAGDVNGDGYSDVIVGAPRYDAGQGVFEGAAFVFLGSSTGIADGSPASAAALLEGNQASARFGYSVASAGDVNGDGYADVIIGAPRYDADQIDEGAAFLFTGSALGIASGSPASAAARIESNQAGPLAGDEDDPLLGYSVAAAGDLNGDGFGDVVVGAYRYDSGLTDEGAAFVYQGGGNRTGRRVLARQLRGGGVPLPVLTWGLAQDSDDFQVRVTATHPLGRGRVKLQVQACESGIPFGHANCATSTSASWTDVTATSSGATLTRTVGGLATDALYRWRARVLYAPFSVTQSGITAPPNPAHGPWRRLFGQALDGDLRTLGDDDDDNDGLLDAYETDSGIYVSPTDTGTDPNDPDSDDDGLLDGAEVALGTDPLDADHDDDGDLDGADNCPLIVNANQANGDVWAAGDACQCGDVTGDGVIAAADYQLARQHVVKGTALPAADRCDVNGDSACDVEDLAVLERLEALVLPPPPLLNECDAYTTP